MLRYLVGAFFEDGMLDFLTLLGGFFNLFLIFIFQINYNLLMFLFNLFTFFVLNRWKSVIWQHNSIFLIFPLDLHIRLTQRPHSHQSLVNSPSSLLKLMQLLV